MTEQPKREPVTYSCGGCVTRWRGVSRAHCSGCHRTFSTVNSFDLHRTLRRGEGVCIDPATIRKDKGRGAPLLVLRGALWRYAAEFTAAGGLFGDQL